MTKPDLNPEFIWAVFDYRIVTTHKELKGE
jgi:hypothetical protein